MEIPSWKRWKFNYVDRSLCLFFFKCYLFIYIFDCVRSSLLHGLFSSCEERGLLSGCRERTSRCGGLQWLFLLLSTGFSSYGPSVSGLSWTKELTSSSQCKCHTTGSEMSTFRHFLSLYHTFSNTHRYLPPPPAPRCTEQGSSVLAFLDWY